jgi:hypothetical protein
LTTQMQKSKSWQTPFCQFRKSWNLP